MKKKKQKWSRAEKLALLAIVITAIQTTLTAISVVAMFM